MMLLGHGFPKLMEFSDKAAHFPDPLGVGHTTSLVLAILGEAVASAFIIVGLGTRLASVPFLITMLVAAFFVHAGDPFSDKEHALLFAAPAVALMLMGPGRFSLDAMIMRRRAGGSDADEDA